MSRSMFELEVEENPYSKSQERILSWFKHSLDIDRFLVNSKISELLLGPEKKDF